MFIALILQLIHFGILCVILLATVFAIRKFGTVNSYPVYCVRAVVTNKKPSNFCTNTAYSNNQYLNNKNAYTSCCSPHFVLFQDEAGTNIELTLSKHEYDMLLEGDIGKLTFKGNKFLAFEREA